MKNPGRLSKSPSAHLTDNQKAIAELQYLYFRYRFVSSDPSGFVQWAIERLQLNEEGNDLDIVLLAALRKADRAQQLIESIFRKYGGLPIEDEQLLAGKYVALLYERYLAGGEAMRLLCCGLVWDLYVVLDYPPWLSTLSRNCDLAESHGLPSQEPVEQEFQYIAHLWSLADSYEEFERLYDPQVSRQHDW
jgi:hypothetical protein